MPGSLKSPAGEFNSVLVTGASSGIGLAIAEAFLEAGLQVYGTSRSPEQPRLHKNIQWLPFEGATPEGLAGFLETNKKLLSNIDILINNSGSSYFGKASNIPLESRNRQHHLLYEAPVSLTETVYPHMRSRRMGAIINVSSLAAIFTIPYLEDYSSSKSQLSRYTQKVIASSNGTGIMVIDFQPGDYRTGFNRNLTRYGAFDSEGARVWRQLERHLQKGPPPERAAMDILSSIRRGRSGIVRSGTFFQSKVAPIGYHLLPRSVVTWATRKYYRI